MMKKPVVLATPGPNKSRKPWFKERKKKEITGEVLIIFQYPQ